MSPSRAKRAATIKAARKAWRAPSGIAQYSDTKTKIAHSNAMARLYAQKAMLGERGVALGKLQKQTQALVKKSHQNGMLKVGRQKSDMSGGNQVNRQAAGKKGKGRPIINPNLHPLHQQLIRAHIMAAANREPVRAMGKPVGMAGAKRPKGPASASSVSAARKKAWATRRKKFGKSGGKKR